MQTIRGTLKANAIAKCSLDMPISPALAPTISMTHEGAPDVRPYSVVFKYRSCPARSKQSYHCARRNICVMPTTERHNFSGSLRNFLPSHLFATYHVWVIWLGSIGQYWSASWIEPQDLVNKSERLEAGLVWHLSTPPFQHWTCVLSLIHAYVERGQRVPVLFRHPRRLYTYVWIMGRVSTMKGSIPRVRTPRVVDFPLSTLPTTATRTSGVNDTLGGGNRSNNDIRGCPARISNSVDTWYVWNQPLSKATKWFGMWPTFPPTSSTTLDICACNLSISSTDRGVPDHSMVSSLSSPANSSVCDGSWPIRKTYSPLFCVRSAAIWSRARS